MIDRSPVGFVDIETTGLLPSRHQIWEVGLLLPDTNQRLEWQLPVNLDGADTQALTVSRFYKRYLGHQVTGPTLSNPLGGYPLPMYDTDEFARAFVLATEGVHLAGMNPHFDVSFLAPLLQNNGQVPMWHYHLIDVEVLMVGWLQAKGTEVPIPWKSTELSLMVGIDPDTYDRHTALGDAEWALAVYHQVMGG